MARRRQQTLANFFVLSHCSNRKHPLDTTAEESIPWSHSKRRKRQLTEFQAAAKSSFGTCPLCQACLPVHVLMPHAETCDGSSQTPPFKCNSTIENKNVTGQRSQRNLNCQSPAQCDTERHEASRSLDTKNEEAASTSWWPKTSQQDEPDNCLTSTSEPLPGLYVFEDFISEEEEERIIAELDGTSLEHRHQFLPWKPSRFNGPSKGKRWGVHCNLRERRVDAPENPMPSFFHTILLEKLQRLKHMANCIPNEANAIDYQRQAGHYLKNHVDDRQLSKEPIANLSIAGDCIMSFKNEKLKLASGGVEIKRVLLKRRTLQVLTGKARYDYSHGIQNQDLLSDRRVSVTMRESPLTSRKK